MNFLAKPKALIRRIRFSIPDKHTIVHKGEHFFHMSYLGAVSWEAHGLYAHAAQILFVFTIAGVFVKEHESEQHTHSEDSGH